MCVYLNTKFQVFSTTLTSFRRGVILPPPQMTFENNDLDFDRFKAALDESIQRHAPIKKRYVRVKQALFLNKKINEEIMKR